MSTRAIDARATGSPPAPLARRRQLPDLGAWGIRGVALLYLGLAVGLPVVAILMKGFSTGLGHLQAALSRPGAWEALRLTFTMAIATAVINAVFGTLIAYVLARYRFWGRGLLSAIVDLPFAIPTLVTGVMLVALYGPASPVGAWLQEHGIQVAFAQLGILIALLFVTLPFVIRTVLPVIAELDIAEEEAAFSLGAGGWTTFRRVVLPALKPAIAAGSLLAFARALGEFGAVVVIAGNLTGKTLTAPVFIFQLTNQFQPEQAAAIAAILFAVSFVIVIAVDRLIAGSGRRS